MLAVFLFLKWQSLLERKQLSQGKQRPFDDERRSTGLVETELTGMANRISISVVCRRLTDDAGNTGKFLCRTSHNTCRAHSG